MNIENLAAAINEKIDKTEGVLNDFKKTHLALFLKKGFKEIIPDSYKFTNLESFFKDCSPDGAVSKDPLPSFETNFSTIILNDGELILPEALPDGVTVRRIKPHFNEYKTLFTESNSLSHLHHALFNEGVIIEIAKGTQSHAPLRILNLISKASISAQTNLILAHPMSKLTVIEESRVAEDVSHAVVSETYILAQKGAQIEHVSVDSETPLGLNHSSLTAQIDQDASVSSVIFTTSGKMNRKNLTLNLNAPGSHGESYALFLTSGSEHSDINTEINHRAPDSTSNQIAKGILDGESKGIFTGKIHIFPKAQRVRSGQLNKNLLLSKKAHLHSQPQLEIFADDVKCSHGSTTGQLSDDEVFYFQARGIPEDKARNLLAMGFGLEIVQKIQNLKVREYVTEIIREKLAEKFSLGRGL